jgi:hypothetical protein
MVPMSGFEIVFDDDGGIPQPGTTVEIEGELWEVASVDESSGTPRVHLVGRGRTDVAAHQLASVSAPVTLAAPTSFEGELVYTLNDLSSRLNTLAGALNAYWGTEARGAA